MRRVAALLTSMLAACAPGTVLRPNSEVCFDEQLRAMDPPPERIVVRDNTVMSCRARWHPDLHCWGGRPDGALFPLQWDAWEIGYSYHDGRPAEIGVLDDNVGFETMVAGPAGECLHWNSHHFMAPFDQYYPWRFDGWEAEAGDCTLALPEQCLCQPDGTPADPACYDITVP